MNKADFKFSHSKSKLLKRSGDNSLLSKDQLNECARMATKNGQLFDERAALVLLFALFVLLQACLSAANYSGHQNPPMFGDFEAQRHWMEITVNLSPKDWFLKYVNSSANDLDYWGLDYPPLTAYHSWLLGQIAALVDPSWVRLGHSRGSEGPRLKLFMRLSVVVTMSALFAPALVRLLLSQVEEKQTRHKGIGRDEPTKVLGLVAAALLFPGLLFVDCAHFQYNHCSLGLFLWALYSLERGQLRAGAILFVLALNHKQMELYHAMPVAVFLFARSAVYADKRRAFLPAIGPRHRNKSVNNLLQLAVLVLLTFAILWLPFLWPQPALALRLLRRLFPFQRGLFEDKVANFWCCASILIKFKKIYSTAVLVKASAFLVFVACAPSLICLLFRPSTSNLRVALTANALAFFLFSFQVHEKSILLAVIPALLLINDKHLRMPTALFLTVSLFSLFPLCLKDGVAEVFPLFFAYAFALRFHCQMSVDSANVAGCPRPFLLSHDFLFCAVLVPSSTICALQMFASPPVRLPHLFPMLNALFSFAVFAIYWLYLNVWIVDQNWTVLSRKNGMR